MMAPKVWKNPWVVHIQNIGTGEHALKYLAQYIFRPAISNKRILEMSDAMVSFGYRDSKTCKWRKMRVEAMEFIRRYLQHVLPRGFVKVRYYGLYAHRNRSILQKIAEKMVRSATPIRQQSTAGKQSRQPRDGAPESATAQPHRCPCCGESMIVVLVVRRGGGWPMAPPVEKKARTYHL